MHGMEADGRRAGGRDTSAGMERWSVDGEALGEEATEETVMDADELTVASSDEVTRGAGWVVERDGALAIAAAKGLPSRAYKINTYSVHQ